MTNRNKKQENKSALRCFSLISLTSVIIATICFAAATSVFGCNVTITQQSPEGVAASSLTVQTDRTTVRNVLAANDIELGKLDEINYDLDERVEDKTEIIITRKTPIVIKTGDKKIAVSTAKNRVSEVLAEGEIEYSKDDIITPAPDKNVGKNREIDVVYVSVEEEAHTEYTDFETEYRDDNTIEDDVIVQEGQRGEVLVTEKVRYEGDKEISRTEISREVKSEPQNQIIARATDKKSSSNTIDINGLKFSKKLSMVATAYSAYNSAGEYGTTAMGVPSRYGVVAVDKNVIPLGTKVYVENYGVAIAADTGGAIKGNRIDLCFEDTEENLMAYGRQNISVYILEDQN